MITSQDIKNKTFEKAVFGGYDMGGVDEFLDELAVEIDEVRKENTALKGKLRVLAAKVEEYRSNEDALRTAILSAQKLGNMIEKEARDNSAKTIADANAQAEKTIADANAEAKRITGDAAVKLRIEESKLELTKKQSAEFLDNMSLLCQRQQEFLNRVNGTDFVKEMRAPAAAAAEEPKAAAVNSTMSPDSPEVHEAVKSIEEALEGAGMNEDNASDADTSIDSLFAKLQ